MRISSAPALCFVLLLCGCSGDQAAADADLAQAKAAYQSGDLPTAESAAARALEERPEDTDARATLAAIHRRKGRLALEAGEYGDALEAFRRAGFHEPYRAKRARDLLAALEAGEAAGASSADLADIAEAAVEADPSSEDARRAAARHLDNSGRSQEALPHYLWLWESDRDDATVALRLGAIYASAGEPDDAAVVFEALLSSQPKNVQAALGLAAAYEALGKNRRAMETYEDLLAGHRDNPGILFRFADFLDRRGKRSRADSLREEARERMPGVERREMRDLR